MDFSQDAQGTHSGESEAVNLKVDQLTRALDNPAVSNPASSTGAPIPPTKVIWVHRLFLIVRVVFCIELGMLLTILPWTNVWIQNSYLGDYPALRSLLQLNFIRGLVSGFGLIDIWIGIWEAVHYRDPYKR